MKFKLFGRFREGEDGEEPEGRASEAPQIGQETGPGAGEVERTVDNMFSQGYTADEVRGELENQYSPERVEKAITRNPGNRPQSPVEGPEPRTPYQEDSKAMSPVDQGFNGEDGQPPMANGQVEQPGPEIGQGQQPPERPMQPETTDSSGQETETEQIDPDIERLVETIIAENFDTIEQEFEHLYSRFDSLEEEVEQVKTRVNELEVRDDEDHQEFIQKVEDMEEHVDQYNARIGGLEKSFQEVLPSLVDNVQNLTTLVQEAKQDGEIETKEEIKSQDIEGMDLDDW